MRQSIEKGKEEEGREVREWVRRRRESSEKLDSDQDSRGEEVSVEGGT